MALTGREGAIWNEELLPQLRVDHALKMWTPGQWRPDEWYVKKKYPQKYGEKKNFPGLYGGFSQARNEAGHLLYESFEHYLKGVPPVPYWGKGWIQRHNRKFDRLVLVDKRVAIRRMCSYFKINCSSFGFMDHHPVEKQVYWVLAQDGVQLRRRTPRECVEEFEKDEAGLTIVEAVCMCIQYSQILRMRHFIDATSSYCMTGEDSLPEDEHENFTAFRKKSQIFKRNLNRIATLGFAASKHARPKVDWVSRFTRHLCCGAGSRLMYEIDLGIH